MYPSLISPTYNYIYEMESRRSLSFPIIHKVLVKLQHDFQVKLHVNDFSYALTASLESRASLLKRQHFVKHIKESTN